MSLICPVCGAVLPLADGARRCEKGHCFDRARSGYFNLLMDSSSHGHGDDKAMLRARRAFLEAGWYAPLAGAVSDAVAAHFPGGSLTDAGCGEGYYTEAVLNALAAGGTPFTAFAFDVSKEAARMTASRLKDRATVFVASAYHAPLADASQNLILSVFSPFAREEYARILAPGGILLRVVPMPDHLWELKEALYEAPRQNLPDPAQRDAFFTETESIVVQKSMTLPRDALASLFDMTPYARKTAPADREKLALLRELSVTLSCKVILSVKNACRP